MLLEALLRKDTARNRLCLAFPCDGPDLVVAGLLLPSPVQPRPASRPRTLRVLMLVELEAILGRSEVEAFVQLTTIYHRPGRQGG